MTVEHANIKVFEFFFLHIHFFSKKILSVDFNCKNCRLPVMKFLMNAGDSDAC